jgi:hypothetical protein
VPVAVALDLTNVDATDAPSSATHLAETLDRPAPVGAGPSWDVDLDDGVSLDDASAAEEEVAHIPSLHLAFLLSEEQFDATDERITSRDVEHPADPQGRHRGETDTHGGGRGADWADPDGHPLGIITVPYGGWLPGQEPSATSSPTP